VTLRLRYAREMAHLEVHDTGPGMPADELARIFEPFARGSTAAVGVGSTGSGLGLTIAKMLTDLMGGELIASSVLGQGSVFGVRLFLPQIHNMAGGALSAFKGARVVQRKTYAGARRKILVVDNEETDRELLVSLLAPMQFEMRTAASGHDALDLWVAGVRPDAVFLDLAMPGIDGWETLRRMRVLGGVQPAVAIVSANAFDRGLENTLGVGAEDFFVKPVRHSELLDWLERKLDLQWVEAQASAASAAPSAASMAVVPPPRQALLALQELVRLGFYRGIVNKLDALAQDHPGCGPFTQTMRALAQQYQFEAMLTSLQSLLDDPQTV
jgi:CheY-like chemotaxis protein